MEELEVYLESGFEDSMDEIPGSSPERLDMSNEDFKRVEQVLRLINYE